MPPFCCCGGRPRVASARRALRTAPSSCGVAASRAAAIVVLVLGFGTSTARAADLIFPGTDPKAQAGAGQIGSRGAEATFTNPANIIFAHGAVEPYGDLALAKVTYTYAHPDAKKYDPVTVDVVAPPITVGVDARYGDFAAGLAVVPSGTGSKSTISKAPIETTDGIFEKRDVSTGTAGYTLGMGGAWRLPFGPAIGAGILYTTQHTTLTLDSSDTGDLFLDADCKGSALQAALGGRGELFDKRVALAGSYRSGAKDPCKGQILLALDPSSTYVPYESVTYLPPRYGFGAEYRYRGLSLFFDFVREAWGSGRTVATRGFGTTKTETDLLDANDYVVGVKGRLDKRQTLTGAVGHYEGNIGDGSPVDPTDDGTDPKTTGPKVQGVTFGSLDAIPRYVAAGGYRLQVSPQTYAHAVFEYQTGSRTVPPGFNGEGSYTLRVILLGVGAAYAF